MAALAALLALPLLLLPPLPLAAAGPAAGAEPPAAAPPPPWPLPPGQASAPRPEGANGQGPKLAESWSADMIQSSGVMVNTGKFYYDRAHQRMRRIFDAHQSIFTQDDRTHTDELSVNAAGLNTNATIGLGPDAVCKAMSVPYVDQFAFLALAHPNGSSVVDGVPCDVWTLQGGGASISACVAADGVPRELNSSAPGRGSSTTRLGNVTVGPLDPAIFATSQVCATRYPTKACPEDGLTSLTVYRIHGAGEPLELTDRNAGDALGDTAFVCVPDALMMYRTKLVSQWVLTANTSWGQYATCLFMGGKNTCVGGTGKQVGRQSALGLGKGHLQGQCSANDDVGSWYSLPAAGECAPGAAVGAGGCSWGGATRQRTVAASCILEDRGLAKVCAEERGHAPLLRSAAIFRAALASSDPAKGGCPDVAPQVVVV